VGKRSVALENVSDLKDYCHETLKLPTLSKNMPDDFRRALQSAYESYDMPNIVRFRNSNFQWCKKFTFTSPNEERRYTFKLGDYIKVKQQAQPTQCLQEVVRIDQIFIHEWDKEQRLFTMATRTDISDNFDQLLEYRILRLVPEDAPFISAFLWCSLASCTSCQSSTIQMRTGLDDTKC
jgi:hypothetical protein